MNKNKITSTVLELYLLIAFRHVKFTRKLFSSNKKSLAYKLSNADYKFINTKLKQLREEK